MINVNTLSLDLVEHILYIVVIRPGEYAITTNADQLEWYRERGFTIYTYCQVNDSTLISNSALIYTLGAAVLAVASFLVYVYMRFHS